MVGFFHDYVSLPEGNLRFLTAANRNSNGFVWVSWIFVGLSKGAKQKMRSESHFCHQVMANFKLDLLVNDFFLLIRNIGTQQSFRI